MTTTTLSVPEKFDLLEDALNSEIMERTEEIGAMSMALCAGVSLFMLGSPGIAKSMLADRLRMYLSGGQYFNILMMKMTQADEVFGPISLKGLKEDRFERITTNTLVDAHFAMIDEIFKANSAILNALLWAINERKYKHGTSVIKIPLSTMFCASNELPTDTALGALYDRLLFRFEVSPVRDTQNFQKMLSNDIDPEPKPVLSWDDVLVAQEATRKVIVPDIVIEAMTDLRKNLAEKGIEPTDRRFVQCKSIIRAAAYLDGCEVADVEHMQALEHVLWDQPSQRGDVSNLVLARANPLDQEANELMQELAKLEDQLDSLSGSDDDRFSVGNEIHTKITRAAEEIEKLEARAGGSRKRSKKLKAVNDKCLSLTDRVLDEVFHFDPDDKK